MKKMRKHIISTALMFALLILLTTGASGADAAGTTGGGVSGTWGNLNWTLDSNGLLTISGSGAMADFEFVSNSAWRAYAGSIQAVIIKSGVTAIGKHSFCDCALTDVTIPSSVTTIGDAAFYRCTGLKNVAIPSSVTAIEGMAFAQTGLTSVMIPPRVMTVGGSAFYGCNNLTSATISTGMTSISSNMFNGCSRLTSVTIPHSVTTIGNFAFADCNSLTNIYYSGTQAQWNAVTKGTGNDPLFAAAVYYSQPISSGTWGNLNWALDSNGRLTISGSGEMNGFVYDSGGTEAWQPYRKQIQTVKINSGVSSICRAAFYECDNLVSISIPSSVTKIGSYVFYGCDKLPSITIPSSVASIDEWTFCDCDSLTGISLPSGISTIPFAAFWDCDNLQNITIPSSVTRIEPYAFDNCDNLTTVYFQGTQTQWNAITKASTNEPLFSATIHYNSQIIDSGTWGNLTWTLDNNGTLTIFGNGAMNDFSWDSQEAWRAYQGNRQVTSVSIGSGVTSIGDYAFEEFSLSSISIPSNVTSIGDYAFAYNSRLTSITIPGNVTNINCKAFLRCTGLQNIYVNTSNNYYCDISGVLFDKSITTLVHFPQGRAGQYSIPAGVTRIGNNAFDGCSGLTAISFPSSLRSIGDWSFMGCDGLTSIEIPSGVTSIGNQAFDTCENLASVKVPASVTEISYTFNGCNKLMSAGPFGSGCNYEYGWTSAIPKWAFDGCRALKSVRIPASVTSIGAYAFTYCDSLSDVYFGGSQSQWNAVTKGTGNDPLYSAAIHYTGTTYTITFNANGGTGTPSSQIKEENISLTLSSLKPSKYYTIQYNAAGGTVSPASKNVFCTFNNWNTAQNGSGTSYAPGDPYTTNANVTLYAQWTNPSAAALATPTRSGFNFDGWFTSATGGTRITESSTVSGNMTIYAHWTDLSFDPYNLGDETYSFANYPDSDSLGGHCFGMSITSAGYHNGLLDISKIGGNANTSLYSFSATATVKKPICYYQGIQGDYRDNATVAGGSSYLYGYSNISSDWQEVVSYVRNHSYDGTGLLQIGFRKNNEGGHAINFLRYENVNGQDRIYAYDNNFPTQETYFYMDSSGYVRQTPMQTFSGSIDCIALRDCRRYFNSVGSFDSTHALYMAKDAATVMGYTYSYMEGAFSDEEYVMYEIPADQDRVIIVPNRDYADFIYMDTEYSFGEITDETRGELRFATMDEGSGSLLASFQIYEVDPEFGEPSFTLPSALTQIGESAFEGIVATTVYIPDSCTSIDSYAFRNASIKQIRIPAECSIADTAFVGCDKVQIFGTLGSAAEEFCNSHANCTFIPEARKLISVVNRSYAPANPFED